MKTVIELPKRKTRIITFDTATECAQWALENNATAGGFGSSWSEIGGSQIAKSVIDGNDKAARASDEFLAAFESVELAAWGRRNFDNVAGSVPIVPAYLSGNPMNMRTKRRQQFEAAPLAVIVDSTTSNGIGAEHMAKRGAAILAFCRAVSIRRPVELWAFGGLGGYGGEVRAVFAGHRLETSPVDLSRAGPTLATASWTRNVLYAICTKHGSNGAWPYNAGGPMPESDMEKLFREAMPHLADVLCIPGILKTNDMVTRPVDWIRAALEKYAPQEQ